MGYDCIRIERERTSFSVTVTDPEIQKKNDASRNKDGPGDWTDPQVEYTFETKQAVLTFLDKAMDIALPEDDYSSAFDKLAKEAGGTSDE